MRTIPVLRWPGGKSRLLKHLLPLITPHTCYCEPFAGGLALLLAKDRSQVEVINDLNRDIVALYRCAQFHLEALCKEVEWLIPARENLKDFNLQPGVTDLQRAARFVIKNRMSFAGDGKSFGVHRSGSSSGFSREKLIALLHELSKRLDGVLVENLDWQRCAKLYDSAQTLFFFDPPYLHADINAYAGWDEKQMTEFRDTLRTLQGDWIVTVDGSDFCQNLFSEWHVRPLETKCGTVNNRLQPDRKFSELLITRQAATLPALPAAATSALQPRKSSGGKRPRKATSTHALANQ